MKKILPLLKPLLPAIAAAVISSALPAGAQSLWNGPGAGANNWSISANWLPAAVPSAGTNVLFADAGTVSDAVTIDNTVDTSRTITSLQYGQTNDLNINSLATGFHNTLIGSGVTLTISNTAPTNMLVAGTETDDGTTHAETNTISGGGSLVLNNTNAGSVIIVRQASTTGAGPHLSMLDMSGLGTFIASVGLIHIGNEVEVSNIIQRSLGIWLLAKTNVITASGTGTVPPAIDIGDGHNNGGNGIVQLGITNAIYADSIAVGYLKSRTLTGAFPVTGSTLQFNPAFTNSATPALYLRGNSASRVGILSVGDNSANGGSVLSIGSMNLSGGTVDAMVNTCYIGRGQATNGAGTASGTLTISAGIFDVNTLEIGFVSVSQAIANVTGTVNVNGSSTLRVNTSLQLGENPGASVLSKGALNISGTVLANSIIGGSAGVVSNSVINLRSSGTLVITNTAGTTAVPLSMLSLAGGTLQLNVNGSANVTNIVATIVTNTGGTTTIQIGSLANVTTGITYPLISYTGNDPIGSLSLAPLPTGYTGNLIDNAGAGIVGLILTAVPVTTPPRFTSIGVSGITLNISATNGATGGRYVLLGTTNVAKPLSQWTPLLTNNFDGSGHLNLSTNIVNPALPQEFYILSQ
jgi:hypothetical protein